MLQSCCRTKVHLSMSSGERAGRISGTVRRWDPTVSRIDQTQKREFDESLARLGHQANQLLTAVLEPSLTATSRVTRTRPHVRKQPSVAPS